MLWLIALVVGLYGLLGGSFLNALIWRVHEGRSIVKGRSMCPHCHHQLAAADLVPVASWLMLRGKCRYCSKPISLQYPAVELLTGFLFGLSYYGLHPVGLAGWVNFVVWLYFLGSLIFLAVYDLKWLILPNKILLPAVGVALVWLLARFWWLGWSNAALLGPLKAAAVTGAVFFVLAYVAGGKLMGMGDVKLAILMGLLLGQRKTILALFIAFNSAAIVGVGLILAHRKKRSDHIPFGPFLAAATVVAYLYGSWLINWYLSLATLSR